MKAIILNSGLGSRMGVYTKEHPKCMTDLVTGETILSRQLSLLVKNGITDVLLTTGYYDEVLSDYCKSLNLPINFEFVKNPIYDKTNYIYSIYCARELIDNQDVLLLHGDLVFEDSVLKMAIESKDSCMTVSSTQSLPEKDFKAVLDNGKIVKVGIEFFDNAVAAQPLYKLNAKDWTVWLAEIVKFCESDTVKCYAENAFNVVSDKCEILPLDFKDKLCAEIDNPVDLENMNNILKTL
ncbi:MAG: NTP transferase domain-containing protein [Clostridia bacterium]|nr:NTP transferase domain-containing protein [Clostridia bacterium]